MTKKINLAVWRARATLAAGYLFAAAAALQNGVAGLPPLLPMLPAGTREKVAAGIAIILTLQAVQSRVQKPSGVVRPVADASQETASNASQEATSADTQTGN